MLFIIDGSNLMQAKKIVQDCEGDVILARSELNKVLIQALAKTPDDKATIIYDVHSWGNGSNIKREKQLTTIYAVGKKEEQPADRAILELINREKSKINMLLVSSDKQLRSEAMFLGIPSIDSETFWEKHGISKYW